MVAQIVADPGLRGHPWSAPMRPLVLISATVGKDAIAMRAIAEAIEQDAYTIQGRSDPRRRWAITPILNRETRLESAKTLVGREDAAVARGIEPLVRRRQQRHGLGPCFLAQGPALHPRRRPLSGHRGSGRAHAGGDEALGQYRGSDARAEQRVLHGYVQADAVPVPGRLAPQLRGHLLPGPSHHPDLATCTTEATITTIVVGDPQETGAAPGRRHVYLRHRPAVGRLFRTSGVVATTQSLNTTPSR